jgi:hypothetical protein
LRRRVALSSSIAGVAAAAAIMIRVRVRADGCLPSGGRASVRSESVSASCQRRRHHYGRLTRSTINWADRLGLAAAILILDTCHVHTVTSRRACHAAPSPPARPPAGARGQRSRAPGPAGPAAGGAEMRMRGHVGPLRVTQLSPPARRVAANLATLSPLAGPSPAGAAGAGRGPGAATVPRCACFDA